METKRIYYSIDYQGGGESMLIAFTNKEVRDKHIVKKLERDYDNVYGEGDLLIDTTDYLYEKAVENDIIYPQEWEEEEE